MDIVLKKAVPTDAPLIWEMLQQAIARRKKDGSKQWQDGYPNLDIVHQDIERGVGHIMYANDQPAVYGALIWNDEPAYDDIIGNWLSNGSFLVVHRIAVSEAVVGQGYVQKFLHELENHAKSNQVFSIKVDTNYDNAAMLHLMHKMGYLYCGEVHFRGGARKAFEKLL